MKTVSLDERRAVSILVIKIILFAFLLFIFKLPGIAQANLIVTPTRIVFEDRLRTQEVKLIHKGDKETTYRISFQHLRMKQDGSYEEIETPGPNEQFVDELVTYSPRQVTLKPDKAQTIRLMVRKSKNLPPGEYRSHMLFREVAPSDLGVDIETEGKKTGNISVRMIPLFGVSIPVIVRHGETTAEVEIEEAKLISDQISEDKEVKPSEDKEVKNNKLYKKVVIKLNRHGNASVYGDIIATFTPTDGSQGSTIAKASGIAVFFPNDYREISIPLEIPEGVSLQKGELHIVYQERKDKGGNLLAEKRLTLP